MPSKYASVTTRSALKTKVEAMDACKKSPSAYEKIKDKEAFEVDRSKCTKLLDSITPPDTTGTEKDHLKRRMKDLAEALVHGTTIVPPMPTTEQLWKVPAGSVGQHNAYEGFWKRHTLSPDGKSIIKVDSRKGERGALFEFKDVARTYNKDREVDDPDAASLEMIRPSGAASSLADTKLPRSYGLSWQAKANYDEVFADHTPTPVEAKLAAPVEPTEPEVAKRTRVKTGPRPVPEGRGCQALNSKGVACGLLALPGKSHCFRGAHAAQFPSTVIPTPEVQPGV